MLETTGSARAQQANSSAAISNTTWKGQNSSPDIPIKTEITKGKYHDYDAFRRRESAEHPKAGIHEAMQSNRKKQLEKIKSYPEKH